MENLDSHEKPTLPNYLTRGASGRMLPHGLLVVARRQPPVDPRFRHGSRAGSLAGVSATLSSGQVNVVLIADSLLSCWDGRMTCLLRFWPCWGWERQRSRGSPSPCIRSSQLRFL